MKASMTVTRPVVAAVPVDTSRRNTSVSCVKVSGVPMRCWTWLAVSSVTVLMMLL
jgi:hypothetical protein